jgi:isoleucyl-tRNA synthetase
MSTDAASAAGYREVPAKVDFPALDREVLAAWERDDIFHRSLKQTADGPLWVFYEGPPTANGKPGTHHVEARVFKDVFPRFKTMKGHHVPRIAGWDCHGLPVEIAVEKQLGFSGKPDIEAYGVAEFNAKCRASVLEHVDEFEVLTERMGYWVDFDKAYWTMDSDYVQSVWWSLKQIFNAGKLVQDHRVTPYCPRCGTGLSDHELAQGYETVVDPSVYVRFPVVSGPLAERHPEAALLVWTTTPWTLVSNTAVAAGPGVDYVVARTAAGEVLVVANELREKVLGEDSVVLEHIGGTTLAGTGYSRPFTLVDLEPSEHVSKVVTADYVTTDDGSGLVHIAPAFGAEDLQVGRAYGLPVVNPLLPNGRFDDSVPQVGGQFFKEADRGLVTDLETRGLLFRELPYEHPYPHCWRCHTPLVYYAQPSWYIRTTTIKDELLRENEGTNWFPNTIKCGRYGDWLNNNVDWALSRNRYWGTPLPIWICESGHLQAIGSLKELSEFAGRDVTELDPHRPYVDDVTFPCPTCGETATRTPEVIDGWYDSGSMPFAQIGYPHKATEQEFDATYPADFICEAIDQTRGWFYTLMAVGTLVFDKSSYRNVLCLGHIQDDQGRKMSKHLGNILEPVPLMDEHGADAVRWFMLASGSPWQARRVGQSALQEVVRKVLLTYWNTVAFHSLYARLADFNPATATAPAVGDRPEIDQWLASETNRLARDVDDALEQFDTQRAGRLLQDFIDDVSNWYVRRNRRRFWDGDVAALATLHDALRTLTLLMAPFTPFITEQVWQDLFRPTSDVGTDSVHLASWPQVDESLINDELSNAMSMLRRLVELGRGARAESKVRTRQPLARALVAANGWEALSAGMRAQLAEELNILDIEGLAAAGDLVDISVKPNFRAIGKRFANQTQQVAQAISGTDPATLVSSLRATGSAAITVDGVDIVLTADDIVVTETPREGWAVASSDGETLALDLTITPELRALGLAREAVRLVQEARKATGLEVSDRITLTWQASDEDMAAALREHGDSLAREVLALEVTEASGVGEPQAADAELGVTFWLTKAE